MDTEIRLREWTIRSTRRLIQCDETSVHITPKSMAVLMCLIDAAGDPVSREDIFATVWPGGVVSDETLTGCIFELRKAFSDSARNPSIIETIPQHGFRLIPEVERGNESVPTNAATLASTSSNMSVWCARSAGSAP